MTRRAIFSATWSIMGSFSGGWIDSEGLADRSVQSPLALSDLGPGWLFRNAAPKRWRSSSPAMDWRRAACW
ncbi:protein of unknown function [Thauera humireducens]|nr:protein of unknown function [Thauera humireducens]